MLVANFGDQLQTHCVPIRRFDAINRFKFRSWRNLRICRDGIGRNFTNNRANTRYTDDKHQPVSHDSKEEIGDRSRRDNRSTLANGFIVEGVMAHFRRHRFNTLIQHFDVTTKRNDGNNEFRTLLVLATPERFAETNGKTLDSHAATASNPEMAKFMHGD